MDDIRQLRDRLTQLLNSDVDKAAVIASLQIPDFAPQISEFTQYKQIYQQKYEQIQQVQEETRLLNEKITDLEQKTENLMQNGDKDEYAKFVDQDLKQVGVQTDYLKDKFVEWLQNRFTEFDDQESISAQKQINYAIKCFNTAAFNRDFVKNVLLLPHYTESSYDKDKLRPSFKYRRAVGNFIGLRNQGDQGVDPQAQVSLFEDLLPDLNDEWENTYVPMIEEEGLAELPAGDPVESVVDLLEPQSDEEQAGKLVVAVWRMQFELLTGMCEFLMDNVGEKNSEDATVIVGKFHDMFKGEFEGISNDDVFTWFIE